MENKNKRMAVLVGCNYANTPHELHGCINDVLAMRDVLVKRFGFEHSHIQLLTDAPGSSILPTGENIKKALNQMVGQAQDGDVLYFHYSGHGTRIPSFRPGHLSFHDEAIVPCDLNLITDVDFRQIVNKLPKEASLTILSDSCHSGGLIDREKEQIGPSTINNIDKATNSRRKLIPFQSILQHLSSLTNINTSEIGTHLLECFGANASLKFRLPHLELHDPFESAKSDQGILLSGCQANENSADINPAAAGGKAYGAFSNAIETVLKEHLGKLSNKEVMIMARKVLQQQGIVQQHPCLYCSDENANAAFLGHNEDSC